MIFNRNIVEEDYSIIFDIIFYHKYLITYNLYIIALQSRTSDKRKTEVDIIQILKLYSEFVACNRTI